MMDNNKILLIQMCANLKVTAKICITLMMFLFCFMLKTNAQVPSEQQRLARHVVSLNELTERRRTNRLFQNEQTPRYGQGIYYTNVGRGNTSFIMRDMVLLSRLPIIFARVYDSSAGLGDFGLGWRLNYNETITELDNGHLLYQDESGSEHLIIEQNEGHYYPQYHFAEIQTVEQGSSNQITLNFTNNTSKTFNLIDGRYKLSQIHDVYGNSVDLRYHDGSIAQISNNLGDFIHLSRNSQGLITNIADHHNREIAFTYKNGLLKTSQDLAGNVWKYQYTNKQLHKITDPEQNKVVSFSYYQAGEQLGKTKIANIGKQSFEFNYQGHITTVTNQLQLQNQFEQNVQGVTVAISNSQGQLTRIALNDKLQVVKLLENDITTAELIYNDKNQPSTIIKQGKAYPLDYKNHQLVSIGNAIATINPQSKPESLSANGTNRHYTYNSKGEVIQQREQIAGSDDIISIYKYNNRGLLTSLTVKNDQAHFNYNPFGQLTKITFPNGAHHSYQYNDLGLRSKTTRSDGSSIDYSYNKTGVLQSLYQNDDKGNQQLKEMKYNNHNLASEYIVDGQMMLDIQYDQADNPTRIAYNGKPVNYEYDNYNRLTKVIDGNQHLNYHYQKGESDIRIQQDERTFISRLSKGKSSHNNTNINHAYTRTVGTPHRFVYFDPYLNQFKLPSFEQILATDINHDASQRRRLYNAVAKQKTKQRDFDKPSNSIFIPPIYTAIHCELDFCWELIEVSLDGPTSAIVGQPVSFTATPVIGNMYDENHQCGLQHRFSVNDQIIEYNGHGLFNYTFGNAGSNKVEVRSNCQNCATWNFQYDQVIVGALPPQQDCPENADVTAKAVLSNLPVQPYEYSTTFICVVLPNSPNAIESMYLTSSFSAGEAQDPCKVNQYLDRSEDIKGVGHTHPYFTSAAQYNAGVGCFEDKTPPNEDQLDLLNERNKHFSNGDKDAHPLFKVDAYLGTPQRDAVRFMRKGSLTEGTL